MRIKLTLTYDGTKFCGWQRQSAQVSVQQSIEEAIEKLTGEKSAVTGSGRTDAGVHAIAQVAHFDLIKEWDMRKLKHAINAYLPPEIRVTEAQRAEDGFHARFDAVKKTYLYLLYRSDVNLPLYAGRATRVGETFDSELFLRCAEKFIGTRDFASFMSSGSSVKSTVRTIYSLNVIREDKLLRLTISADGFLYNMVRAIVGLMISVAEGKVSIEDVSRIIGAADRRQCPYTAPAEGLYLESVEYN